MTKGRLEAFSDGVMAIIITIMVLELKVPHEFEFAAIFPLIPIFLAYVLSFVFIGIYWNNHHHMLHTIHRVNGRILWANLHLLFWLSLVPFVTSWMGEHPLAASPTGLYGFVLFMSGVAYYILSRELIVLHGRHSKLATALGSDVKGITSLVTYGISILLSFWLPILSYVGYVIVAIMWLVPDQRIEKVLKETDPHEHNEG